MRRRFDIVGPALPRPGRLLLEKVNALDQQSRCRGQTTMRRRSLNHLRTRVAKHLQRDGQISATTIPEVFVRRGIQLEQVVNRRSDGRVGGETDFDDLADKPFQRFEIVIRFRSDMTKTMNTDITTAHGTLRAAAKIAVRGGGPDLGNPLGPVESCSA